MRTSTPERIKKLTENGFWGNDCLHTLFAQQVQNNDNKLAVIDAPNRPELIGSAPQRLSYLELDALSNRLVNLFCRSGLAADSRLLVQLPNIVELVACYIATSKMGVILSPIPVQYGAHELRTMAYTLKADAVFTVEQMNDNRLADTVRKTLPHLPCLTLADISDQPATAPPPASADANHVLTICWTSGTTGTPKGVPRSHNMWLATARNTMAAGDYQAGETLLAPFPLINMAALAGFLFPWVLSGGTLVLHHPLNPALYLQQLQDEAVNFTIAPPALLNKLAKQPELWSEYDFSALRAIGSGSAPLSPAMIEVMENDYGKPVINFYGSNEGISLFATPDTAPPASLRANYFPRFGAADMPWTSIAHRSVQSKVIDTDSQQALQRSGDVGELCFAGATVFDGYLDHDNKDVFTDDGYFRTGDLVEISGAPPHYYRIVGRCKDIINRGGMKISPSEIDALLETLPGLTEAAVCATADDELGEIICACIVPESGQSISLDNIISYLSAQGLARIKLPQQLMVLDALPRNPLGKVLRNELSLLSTTRATP